MKKLILFAAALAVMTMTSCKKDYECNYDGTYTVDFGNGMTQTEDMGAESWTIESVKEDEAEEKCNDYETQFKNSFAMVGLVGDVDFDVDCSVREK